MVEYKTRHYNSVKYVDGIIEKKSSLDSISSEYTWYKQAALYIPKNLPGIYSYDDGKKLIKMEYIDGMSAYEYFKNNPSYPAQRAMLLKISRLLKTMSNNVADIGRQNSERDADSMYFAKPLQSVRYFINKYSNDLKIFDNQIVINGRTMELPDAMLRKMYGRLRPSLIETQFSFIHGDITLSNIMLDSKSKLFLIDPRGKFGQTDFYGDRRYDLAKLYYSLFGSFDSLNHHNYSLKQTAKGYILNIPKMADERLEKEYHKLFDINDSVLNYIHATIWLSLSPHLEEDVSQTIAAFLKGTELLNEETLL
jgi:tRNA A-37 threonylcarbamoyl transferase component Bud32